jgi:hypothetical protein
MELSTEDQLNILKLLSEEQVALLPNHLQELLRREREMEALAGVGGYYNEPTTMSASKKRIVLPKKK